MAQRMMDWLRSDAADALLGGAIVAGSMWLALWVTP